MSEDANIHRLSTDHGEVILVGTAHVSRQSAELVARVIDEEAPDTVCVELCPTRYAAVSNPDAWREMDVVAVIKEKKVYMLLAHLLLASFQKRVADKLGIKAGEEMLRAVTAANEAGAEIVCADRDIRTTLSRAWRLLGFRAKIRLAWDFLNSVAEADNITEEEVEKLKEQDALEMVLRELGEAMPEIRTVLIDERDAYLAEKIHEAPGNKVVAVVGAGHVPGILKLWGQDIDITELEALPPKRRIMPFVKWGIPLAVVALFAVGFVHAGADAGLQMAKWWLIVNGVMAGLGAVAALAHPATIAAAVAAAPLTSLNPMIAAGWVSGLVEVFIRKPQVLDLERLPDDILSLGGFWRNKVTRVLLIVAFTNLGSMVGTFAAVPFMVWAFGLGAA
ncbi:MAG: TraB/GumN family protein [Desulfatibacillaceae bacterium]